LLLCAAFPVSPINTDATKIVLVLMNRKAIRLHRKLRGKIEIMPKIKLTKSNLPLVYTPGVADVSRAIGKNMDRVFDYTTKWNNVAIVTDGSAVLGLGNLGAEAALPVMEGKAMLFRELAGINAFPICLNTHDTGEIINAVKMISPSFGGINLEDIAAPKCFDIEQELRNTGIPIMHDDQHGTSIVTLAALINSLSLVNKDIADSRISILGAGAAGIGVAHLLLKAGARHVVVSDTHGIIYRGRKENMNPYKREISRLTNKDRVKGDFKKSLEGSDVFIGVSGVRNIFKEKDINIMSERPIVFALSNPEPEITTALAKKAGAYIVGTGRSDLPNQINNALAFPGVFRGALDSRAKRITDEMKLAAAHAIAHSVRPETKKILPGVLDKGYVKKVAAAVARSA